MAENCPKCGLPTKISLGSGAIVCNQGIKCEQAYSHKLEIEVARLRAIIVEYLDAERQACRVSGLHIDGPLYDAWRSAWIRLQAAAAQKGGA